MARKIEGKIGDKYQLSAVLGQGATGTVYAAKNLRTQRRVAIKSLDLGAGLQPGSPELLRFEQEARIAGSIDSPHIVQVVDVEQDPATNLPFLVMELLRGEDLQTLLDRVGPLPVDVALRIAAQACAGLVAAHAAGVVHRDVKPANLFLARREKGQIVVKILDFGIAKIRGIPDGLAGSQVLAAPTVPMTESGQMLGSPLFMSPEQVDATKHVDDRSDLFSLAVTLFTMLAGKAPHADAKGFHMLLRRLVTAPPPPVRTVAHWVSPEVEAFVQKGSAFQREDRFSSAKDMLVALEALLPQGTDLREDMLIGVRDAVEVRGEAIGRDSGEQMKQIDATPEDTSTTATAPKEPDVGNGEASGEMRAFKQGMLADTRPGASKPASVLQEKSSAASPVIPESKARLTALEDSTTLSKHIPVVMIMVIVVITLVAGLLVFAR